MSPIRPGQLPRSWTHRAAVPYGPCLTDAYLVQLAYQVDDIYAICQRLMDKGVVINRPPRDGRMAFVLSPDNISIELLQKGESKAPAEPWSSMENVGEW